jgi:LPS export ABC transporter permease LptG
MFNRALDRYTLAAVLPYLALALLVLSAILLIQQTTKFAEILGSSSAPMRLAARVTLNLLPNILIFTLPMSVLVGVATGFGQLGHDSELTAIQAAGVGTSRVILPPILLGLVFSLLTFYVGFWVAPAAAKNLRNIGLQIAFYKLESPVDPRSFYTGMQGKVIYVREGDKETGQWGRIFMHWQEPGGQVRLVTARNGRLDFSGERTELVLEDARMTTLPSGGAEAFARGEHVTVERSESMRVRDERLDTGRAALARRMQEREPEFDEMGLTQLYRKTRRARASDNAAPQRMQRREALIALHKRLALSFSPIVFAFFGAALGLRVGRGGRSQGILLSLASMLLYYLLSLAGEQLGRAGTLPPFLGPWLAFITAIPCGILLLAARRRHFSFRLKRIRPEGEVRTRGPHVSVAEKRRPFVPGLLDREVLKSVARNFLLIVSTLVLVFFVFTLFELLRFITRNHVSAAVVARYFMYLLPFALVAITPVGTLLSVLVTFALMVRRSESVAWWASGQSVFRLIQPCVFFAVFVGVGVWFVQERVMPDANRRQNALRGMIRTGAVQTDIQAGKVWVSSADTRRIYSYDPVSVGGQLNNLSVFEFDSEALHLERVLVSPGMSLARGASPGAYVEGQGELIELGGGGADYVREASIRVSAGDFYVLNSELNKPTELNSKSLSAYISKLKARGVNVSPLAVVLERKKAEPFSPLIMILVGAPLAFAFGRRGTMVALCIAIGSGLAFLGLTSGFQQAGANGLLTPTVAAWAPSLLFLAVGGYLLTRTRT